jgi:hypothetical protein
MPDSPADEIRRAAQAMRQRAQHAAPGPWRIGNAVDPTRSCNVHTFPGARGVADGMSWLDAEHIASWHPLVALAVADWLAFEAAALDEGAPDDPAGDCALAIARAFLGRPS